MRQLSHAVVSRITSSRKSLRHPSRPRQVEADAQGFGQFRYYLWTGDLGFAGYLWDCLRAEAQFPTLDVFALPALR